MLQSQTVLSVTRDKYLDPHLILTTLNSSTLSDSNNLCKAYVVQLRQNEIVFRRAIFASRLMLVYLSFWQYERGQQEEIESTIQSIKHNHNIIYRLRRIVQWIFVNFQPSVPTIISFNFL